MLVAGDNVIAVEIHQSGPTSSDISFDVELVGSDGAPVLTRGPYLQMATPDEMTLRWRTNTPADSVVRYGDAPNHLTESGSLPAPPTEHEVRVQGLAPGTRSYYQIESGGAFLAGNDADHFFTTSPVPGSTGPVRAWVIGDSGTADNNARAVRDAYLTYAAAHPADLWLMLGDNAYDDGLDSEFQAAVFDMYPMVLRSTPLWPTLGNHDGHSADSATESGPYYDNFTLPRAGEAGGVASGTEAYYSFDYANIHFVCLESYETDRSVGSPMLTWLQADLDATSRDWIIAFWHHPPYTKGSHNSDTEIEPIEMRQNVLPMLEAAGVDLVLCGHSHSYERSYLLDGHYGTSDTLNAETMILDHGDGREDGDGAYVKSVLEDRIHRGAVYAVAGSSGQTSGGSLNHPAMFVSFNELGSMVLDIEGERLHAEFLTGAGQVHDSFTILHRACVADINGDGVVDTRDVVAFLNLWAAGDSRADFNGDDAIDSRDLIAFLNAWAGVC
ncbi:MAG: metallophosphoesterase [Phycisphaerales bacterium]|nr:metallophosphoesterase [Phycisphaerales bacterium]